MFAGFNYHHARGANIFKSSSQPLLVTTYQYDLARGAGVDTLGSIANHYRTLNHYTPKWSNVTRAGSFFQASISIV